MELLSIIVHDEIIMIKQKRNYILYVFDGIMTLIIVKYVDRCFHYNLID